MLKLRAWAVSDLDRIGEIEQSSFSDPWPGQMLEGAFRSPNFIGFVLEEESRVVGYIGGGHVLDEGEVFLVAVDSQSRNKGYGKMLVNEFIRSCLDYGVKRVFLEVRRSNTTAIACYTSCGFIKIAERARYYGDGEDAIIMEKKI